MALTTYRGEKSVGDIADKLYARLTPRQREKAEAALLKANPQLRTITSVRSGSLLRVPDLPELQAKLSRRRKSVGESPDEQVADTLADALEAYATRHTERVKAEQQATKTQLALLKSATFKRALADQPELQKSAALAAEALDARAKDRGSRHKALEIALKEAKAGLKAQIE